MSIKIRVETKDAFNRLEKAQGDIGKSLKRALAKSAYLIEGSAKKLSPVLTGRMRNSITTYLEDYRATIMPLVDYAAFVHDGTRYMVGRPFMQQALEMNERDIEKIVEDEIASVLR